MGFWGFGVDLDFNDLLIIILVVQLILKLSSYLIVIHGQF